MQGKQFYVHHLLGSSPDAFEIRDMDAKVIYRADSKTALSRKTHFLIAENDVTLLAVKCDIRKDFQFELLAGSEVLALFTHTFRESSRFEGQGSAGSFVLDVDQVPVYGQSVRTTWKINDADYNRIAEIERVELGSPELSVVIADQQLEHIVLGIVIGLSQYNDFSISRTLV